jgi:ankyrin repeat protein
MIAASDLPPLPPMERLVELLMDAARAGRNDVIPALLQAGASIDGRDPKGFTPLILASYNGHHSTTAMMIARGADVNCADAARGNTALMGVGFKGYGPIARLLIDAGADVNTRNSAGQTALMMASLFGQTDIVDMLLTCGADRLVEDDAGNTAASLAEAQGNTALARSLTSSPAVSSI